MKISKVGSQVTITDPQGNAYRVVPKWLNNLADAVVKIGKGRGGPNALIENDSDWQVVAGLVDLFANTFPQTWKDFVIANKLVASHQSQKHGLISDVTTKKGGEASIRQLGQWPFEFEIMIKTIWPSQRFDKKFIREFMRRLPVFKTAEKI